MPDLIMHDMLWAFPINFEILTWETDHFNSFSPDPLGQSSSDNLQDKNSARIRQTRGTVTSKATHKSLKTWKIKAK